MTTTIDLTQAPARRGRPPSPHTATIVALCDGSLTVNQIAATTGLTTRQVYNALHRTGMAGRTKRDKSGPKPIARPKPAAVSA